MDNKTDLPSMEDVQNAFHNFGIADYIVFGGMLLGCSGVGLFYAIRSKPSKGSDEATEYLMGGRQMSLFPVSMSLIASFISGITILGTPTEVYLHGIEYLFAIIGVILSGVIAVNFFLPVFYNLQISSTYEYLFLRFDNRVRLFGSILFTVSQVVWLPIVIYVPALAFNQVTGVNVHIVTPIVCLVCIFYTSVGGLKAVVWTDVIQTMLMIGSIFVVIIKSTYDVGGFNTVFQRNYDSGRLQFPSFELDPTIRHSMLTLTIGATAHVLQSGIINQNMIQRFLTLPSYKLVTRALWIYIIGINGFMLTCGYTGLIIYATYYDCDPLTTGLAKAKDQLLPLVVMKSTGAFTGMPGLFVAGVFSAALSSLSTGLNSMSAVVLEDFVKPNRKVPLTERQTRLILRSVVVIFGIVCVALVFVVEKLGTVLQLSMSMASIASGASFGIFISGILLPWVNSKGAFYGGLIGVLMNTILILGSQHAQKIGAVVYPNKITSVAGCDYTFNTTLISSVNVTMSDSSIETDVIPIFKLSYLLYTMLGGCLTVISAIIISSITGNNNIYEKNLNLYSPVMQRWLQRNKPEVPEEKQLLDMLSNGQKK